MSTVPIPNPSAQRERAFLQLHAAITSLVTPDLAAPLLALLIGLDPSFSTDQAARLSAEACRAVSPITLAAGSPPPGQGSELADHALPPTS